ncbi:oocyte zinc finger protein XlCOF6-like [Brachionichthys hirsutus]|uniref:oocyte zinc finger protein XlCOF6-like n=1 Tax=Brachionichthys hirsutus TaxID=412623 RepID=UPI0036052BEF
MIDLVTFKHELTLIMNGLARAVVREVFTAAEKVSFTTPNLETDVVLTCLVDEAVDKVLKAVAVTTPAGEAGVERPPSARPSAPAYILTGSAAVGSQCASLPPQVDANANRESETEDAATPGGEPSSTSALLQADLLDHEYARPSSLPPGAASAAGGGANSRKLRPPAETTERHHRCVPCGMLFLTSERLSDHRTKSHLACSACGATFNGVLRLREHESKQHGLLPYACDHCPKRFNHKAHRDLHVKARHTGEKTCHCDLCGRGYACVSVLKTHRVTHFDKTFICDVCGKSFYHACHLTRHKAVHQEARPHRCSTCGRGFTQAANLRSHQATHGGERQLCSVCGKSYRCLKNHLISRHAHELPAGELPGGCAGATCRVCGKKFPNASQLRVHQRSHSGEKPFRCDVCGKSYRLRELLRDHGHAHSGERPYRCALCPKTFSLATSLARHRSIHGGATPHSCGCCGKHFRLLAFLKAHLQTKAHLKQAQRRSAPDL